MEGRTGTYKLGMSVDTAFTTGLVTASQGTETGFRRRRDVHEAEFGKPGFRAVSFPEGSWAEDDGIAVA